LAGADHVQGHASRSAIVCRDEVENKRILDEFDPRVSRNGRH
jgi:hypothetical protein